MLESIITGVATRAVVATASRASRAGWVETATKTVLRAKRVGSKRESKSVKSAQILAKGLESFIESDLCESLALTFALRYASDRAVSKLDNELSEAFIDAAASYLGTATAVAEQIALPVWARLTSLIQMSISDLLQSGEVEANDSLLASNFNSVRQTKDQILESNLAISIHRLKDLASQGLRVDSVDRLIKDVRTATQVRYRMLDMPHMQGIDQVPFRQLYIDRTLEPLGLEWQQQTSQRWSRNSQQDRVPEAMTQDRRRLVVGNPGAGKSTLVRNHLLRIATETKPVHGAMQVEMKYWPDGGINVVDLIVERLLITCQVTTDRQVVIDSLTLGRLAIVFDAIDEAPSLASRRAAASAIELFARKFPLARIMVTSREVGYSQHRVSPIYFSPYRLPEFTPEEVAAYVLNWFNYANEGGASIEPAEFQTGFMHDSIHVQDLRSNPLLLSLICLSYRRLHHIPQNRAEIYRSCARLLFHGWDSIRAIAAPVDLDRKTVGLLQEIAQSLNSALRPDRRIGELELRRIVDQYMNKHVTDDHILAESRTTVFIEYCAGRSWVLSKAGGGGALGERVFAFTHKTFLEYYYACYLVGAAGGMPELAAQLTDLLATQGNEVIIQLAIDEHGQYDPQRSDDLLRSMLYGSIVLTHRPSSVKLSFAVRALSFLAPGPPLTRAIIRSCLDFFGREAGNAWLRECEDLRIKFPLEFSSELVIIDQLPPSISGSITEIKRGCAKFRAIHPSDGPEGPNAAVLVISDPELLVDQILTGEIEPQDLIDLTGPGALLEFQSEGLRIAGPLYISLLRSITAGYLEDHTVRLLEFVYSHPDSISIRSISRPPNVLGVVLSQSDWSQHQMFGTQRPAAEQSLPGFPLLLAALAISIVTDSPGECAEVYRRLTGSDLTDQSDAQIADILTSPVINHTAKWDTYLQGLLALRI